MPAQQPQMAPQWPGQQQGGLIGNLFGGNERNQTIQALMGHGLDQGTATLYAGNRRLLQQYLMQRQQGVKPTVVNGQLVDPSSGQVIGDYRDQPEPDKPLVVNPGQTVLGPDNQPLYTAPQEREKRERSDMERSRRKFLRDNPGANESDFLKVYKAPSAVIKNTNTLDKGEPGDEELRTKLQGKEGERWDTYQQQGTVAAGMQQDMEILGELINVAPQGVLAGRLAEYFPGFSDAGDAFESIVKRLAPSLRAPGSGTTSDIEYEGFLKGLPRLRNTEGGNSIIYQTIRAKSELNIRRAEIISKYLNNEIGDVEARSQLGAINRTSIMTPELKKAMFDIGAMDEAKRELREKLTGGVPMTDDELLDKARDAKRRGATDEEVRDMLEQLGVDPSRL